MASMPMIANIEMGGTGAGRDLTSLLSSPRRIPVGHSRRDSNLKGRAMEYRPERGGELCLHSRREPCAVAG